MATAVTVGLLARIEAKPGRESDAEDSLQQGLLLVEQEPGTVRWLVAHPLGENTDELFEEPTIEQVDVIAERDPQ